jgi:serine/threonine protein kinase
MVGLSINNKDSIDYRADLFALGVLLYKMMYNRYPFDNVTEDDILECKFKFPEEPKRSKEIEGFISKY